MLRSVPDNRLPIPRSGEVRAPVSRFRWTHVWLPLGIALLLMAWLRAGADQQLADALFRIEGGRWAWRDAAWAETGLHRGGRAASIAAWALLACAWVLATLRGSAASWRQVAGYVLTTVLAATLAVSALKAVTHVDCPWDLARYGGTRPLLGLWHARPEIWSRARCFPAGHASGGYAWVALYFAAHQVAPRRRRAALVAALGTGLVFGIGQQLRGAHFASHDVASALVCWLVALGAWKAWPWTRRSSSARNTA